MGQSTWALRTSKSLNGASFSTDISNPASSGRGSISVRTSSSEKHKHKDSDFSGKNNNRTSNNSSDTDMELASELEKLKLQESSVNEIQCIEILPKSQSDWNTIG